MTRYPPPELCPEFLYRLPELQYPETLNVCDVLLDSHVREGRGAFPAVFFNQAVRTYQDVLHEVRGFAALLAARGVRSGDRVLLRLLNRPQFVSTWLAVLRIGAVAVSTAPLLKAREIHAILESSKPAVIVTESELAEEIEKISDRPPVLLRVPDAATPTGGSAAECLAIPADTPGIIAYTSGSTGVPKGCMHSHRDLIAVTDSYARHVLQPASSDRFGGHPTLAFVYGLGGMLLFPFRFGASTVLLDRFTPDRMIETIRTHQVTIPFCAPTTYRMLLKLPLPTLREGSRSIRFGISAGETLPAAVFEAWKNATGLEILDGLGSTEMLHIFISSRPGRARAGATGEVVPGYEARIVDERMNPLPDGTPGLLSVRGPTGCRYMNLPDRQKAYVRDGWNIPNDVYVRDSDGFFHYQCRNDDLILCGGNNIAGPEVEAVMLEHPSIQEVAVVASPDQVRGFVPKAFVVLSPGVTPSDLLASELQDFVKSQLALYKYPRRIEFLSELPKTSTGKLRRSELRARETG